MNSTRITPPSFTRLFRNDTARGHWLKVALKGAQAEPNGIGSRVTVVSGGQRMIREIDGGVPATCPRIP